MKAKYENGTVKEYNVLPTYYLINGVPHNLRTMDLSVVEDEGFFDVIEPPITVYQRLEPLILSDFDPQTKLWTKRIYDFTPQEVIDYDEEQADKIEEEILSQRLVDGQDAIRKLKIFIRRKISSGNINQNLAETIKRALKPIVDYLNEGEWLEAQRYFTPGEDVYIDPPANQYLLQIYDKIKNGIDNYVTNNY